jgi:hypothetical protein
MKAPCPRRGPHRAHSGWRVQPFDFSRQRSVWKVCPRSPRPALGFLFPREGTLLGNDVSASASGGLMLLDVDLARKAVLLMLGHDPLVRIKVVVCPLATWSP